MGPPTEVGLDTVATRFVGEWATEIAAKQLIVMIAKLAKIR